MYKFMPYENIMNTNETQKELFSSLVKVIAETKDIHADSTNPFHRNKYASLGAHLSGLKAIFAKHGLAVLQFPVSDSNGGVGVNTTIIHESGQKIGFTICLPQPTEEGVDKDGKAFRKTGFTGQQAGAIVSYLRRYALASVSGVATEDDDAEVDRIASGGQSVKSVNYIPNKTAAVVHQQVAQPSADGDIDPSLVVPFGRSKGQPIGSLSKDDLRFWAETWEPRPYEKTGKVTKKDANLKATAVALYGGSAPKAASQDDDVPFTNDENPY